jgi:hypothetical protein
MGGMGTSCVVSVRNKKEEKIIINSSVNLPSQSRR